MQARVKPLVVSGQAVHLCVKAFLSQSSALRVLAPFLSKDWDIFGNADTLLKVAKLTG